MKQMKRAALGMAVMFCLPTAALQETAQQSDKQQVPSTKTALNRRPPRIEDFLKLQEFGVARPSPDGRLIAVEILRPRAGERRISGIDYVFARSDIWIVDVASGSVNRITNGAADGSWYWSPVWAPNSQRLLLLAGRPGGHIRLALWERGHKGLRILTDVGIDLDANFGALSPYPPDGRVAAAWIDDDRLLTVLLAEGTYHWFAGLSDIRHLRSSQWTRTEQGGTAVTVWDNRRVPVCGTDSTLVLIDVEKRQTVPLLKGAVRAVSLSPDGRLAAVVIATGSQVPNPDKPAEVPLEWNAYGLDNSVHTALKIVDITHQTDLGSIADVSGLTFLSRTRAPRWSQDSRHVVVPARPSSGKDIVQWVSVPELKSASFDADSALDAEVLTELLASTKTLAEARMALPGRETFVGAPLRFGEVPGDVVRLLQGRIGVILNDQITILNARGRQERRFTAPKGGLVYPRAANPDESPWLLFDSGRDVQRAEIDQAATEVITKPSSEAQLVAVIADKHLVYTADRDDGSYLWITKADGSEKQTVFAINQHLRAVAPPPMRIINYSLPNGEPRKGLVLLPPDYVAGRRYPAVIEAYPSVVITDDRLSRSTLHGGHVRTLLAAAGYVVLYPSVPIPPGGEPLEILNLVVENVLPAADALVQQGFADPSQLGLYGHSYSGFAALAVASQTNRFKAIVVSASFGDLVTYADSVGSGEMLDCGLSMARSKAFELEAEDTVLRMRARPLAQLDRYLRNSPYFHLENIKSPVLFLHGELDVAPVAVAERMFVALDRLGIPVKLARYWGEEHVLKSPGNIRDSWNHTVDWFDTYLRGTKPAEATRHAAAPPSDPMRKQTPTQ
jgi:dipeptidyl aminopeptidase/acylaminoacyl peptidase